jgi:hypothetical protein
MPAPEAHFELEPRAADLLELLRDLGHLDDAAVDAVTSGLVEAARPGRVVSFDEVRRAAAVHLFAHEESLRPEAKELLGQEWARLFS